MCFCGRPGTGSSRALTRTLACSDSGQPPPNRLEPQTEQKVLAEPSSGWWVRSSSSPLRIVTSSLRTRPFAVPTPPESFLQVVQWQNDRGSKSSGTSNRTPPHWQLPRSATEPSLPRRHRRDESPAPAGLSSSDRARRAARSDSLTQLQRGDLVRGHHGVPGVSVGSDCDPERAAALDRLALGDDAGVRDPGGVALSLLGEPDRAIG